MERAAWMARRPDANGIGVIHSSANYFEDHVSTAWGMDETLSVIAFCAM